MKDLLQKRGSTLLLRLALAGITFVVLFFSSFMVAEVYNKWAIDSPELASWRYPIIAVIVGAVLTFLFALLQIWNLLGLVDKNRAFSTASVKAMRNIKYCGFAISALFATWSPLALHAAQNEDAPGLILIFGTIFIGVPLVVAILAGVAQRLFQNAIDIKSENDLTV